MPLINTSASSLPTTTAPTGAGASTPAGRGPSESTNVYPLIAAAMVPRIERLIDEERDVCAGCGAPTWSYYPCSWCAR